MISYFNESENLSLAKPRRRKVNVIYDKDNTLDFEYKLCLLFISFFIPYNF